MPEPKTREEFEQSTFFRAGQAAKARGDDLVRAVSCLRFGCWQYDAFVAGYDVSPAKKPSVAPAPARGGDGASSSLA